MAKYESDLAEYKNLFEFVTDSDYDLTNEAERDLGNTIEKAEAEAYDELYKFWLHGDYREDGLIQVTNKHYRDYDITFSDAEQREVTVTIGDDTLRIMIDEAILDDDATEADIIKWIQDDISYKARAIYSKEKARREVSKAEREKLTAYKAEQKQKADELKRAELLALIK